MHLRKVISIGGPFILAMILSAMACFGDREEIDINEIFNQLERGRPEPQDIIDDLPPLRPLPEISWHEDLLKAKYEAQQKARPILLLFDSQWCGWCRRLESEFALKRLHDEVQGWVRVKLHADDNETTAEEFGVSGLPALRVVSPTGRLIAGRDGYAPADDLIEWLREHGPNAIARRPDALTSTQPPNSFQVLVLLRSARSADPVERTQAMERLVAYPDLASAEVIKSLEEGTLAAQLSACEILRRWEAPIDEIDPWIPATLTAASIAKLREWHPPNSTATPAISLSSSQRMSALADIDRLLGSNTSETLEILSRLESYGPPLMEIVDAKLSETFDEASRWQLRTLKYWLVASSRLKLEWPAGIQSLASSDLAARRQAAEQLADHVTSDDQQLLLSLFRDPDSLVRELALRGLRQVEGENIERALIDLLQDPEPSVRAAVLKQLAESVPPAVATAVAKYAMQESDPDLVVHAVRVLRGSETSESGVQLAKLTKHDSWQVRAEVAEALSEFNDEDEISAEAINEIRTALEHLLADEDDFVASQTLKTFREFGDIPIEPLFDLIYRLPSVAETAVSAATSDSDQHEILEPHLLKLANADEPLLRRAGLQGLFYIEAESTGEALKKGLRDSEPSVRAVAAKMVYKSCEMQWRYVTRRSQPFSSRTHSITIDALTNDDNLQEEVGEEVGDTEASASLFNRDGEPLDDDNPDDTTSRDTPLDPIEAALLRFHDPQNREPEWLRDVSADLATIFENDQGDGRTWAALALLAIGESSSEIRDTLIEEFTGTSEAVETIAGAIHWLPRRDRLDFYSRLRETGPDAHLLELAGEAVAENASDEVRNAIWNSLIEYENAPKKLAATYRTLSTIYYGSSYFSIEDIDDVDQLKDDVAKLEIDKHPHQGLAALGLLAPLNEGVEDIVRHILDNEASSDRQRRDALRVELLTLKPTEREQRIPELLQMGEMEAAIALRYLCFEESAFEEFESFPARLRHRSFDIYSRQSGKMIVPKLPLQLSSEFVRPWLSVEDDSLKAMAAYVLVLLDEPDTLSHVVNHRHLMGSDRDWNRLVYRAIAYADRDEYVGTLTEIYEDQFASRPYSVSEFYWTIRIMSGRKAVELRSRIRQEIGISRLR